ncbi:MAG: type II secretion system protein [Phycisphaerae bacterium]|nr:type II secretion system protein [Phycisphaerae bacterium]
MTERKGFTLIELMVVIAIISILLTILAPALTAIVRIAKVAVCSSRLETIGKAAASYAGSNEQSLPYRADGSATLTRMGYNYQTDMGPNSACNSNSRAWYLLVVEGAAPPSTFVCPADSDAEGMISDPGYYDFSPTESRPLSYSLHVVLSGHTAGNYSPTNSKHCRAVTMMRNSALAIGADRTGLGTWDYKGSYWEQVPSGRTVNQNAVDSANSENHDRRGQNVLRLDAHVKFEKSSWVGIEDGNMDDNIYTRRGSSGGGAAFKSNRPADDKDSVCK